MSNLFYTATGNPQTGAQGLSAVVRNEFQAIEAGFDAVPALSLTGGYSVTLTAPGSYTYTLPAASGTLTTTTDVNMAVAVETTRAQAAETTLTGSVSTVSTAVSTVSTAVSTETSRATAAEALRATTSALTAETSRATAAEALLAPKLNPTITGLHEASLAVPASAIDCNAATWFTKTISGTTTFTVSNVPSSGTVASFVLELTNGGASTVNWWANVKWPNGTAPTLTASGVDVIGFYTINGGTTWRGLVLGLNVH